MKRTAVRVVPAIALLALGVAIFVPRIQGQNTGQPSTKNGEWPMYTADLSGSKYSPLDQIGATNFSKMEVAWRFKTDNLGPRAENKLEGTPIMVKGTVYATAGTRRAVVALNGRTGEMKWMYALDEGERATRWAPRQLSGRGLSYWTDGRGVDRAFDHDGCAFELVLGARTQVIGLETPGHFELAEVAGVDLVEGRVLAAA